MIASTAVRLAVLSCVACVTHAMKVQGHIKSESDFVFITKFAYTNIGKNSGNFDIIVSATKPGQQIGLYDDQRKSWKDVISGPESCAEKATHARWLSSEITTQSSGASWQQGTTSAGSGADLNMNVNVDESLRPRWWWVVALNCNTHTVAGGPSAPVRGVEITYKIEMTNAGGFFYKQYSWDDQGLPQMYIACFLGALLGLIAHVSSFPRLNATMGHIHPLVRTITLIAACFAISTGCKMITWVVYGSNGQGVPLLDTIGQFMSIATQMMIVLVSILIAKGWTVSTNTLEGHRYLWCLFFSLLTAYVLLWIWYMDIKDPTTNEYIYDTVPGMFVVAVRLAAFIWFCVELKSTMEAENIEGKTHFYRMFGVAMGFWNLSFPVYVAIGAAVEPWYKVKVMYSLSTITNLVAVISLIALFWPRWVASNFKINRPDVMASNTPYDLI